MNKLCIVPTYLQKKGVISDGEGGRGCWGMCLWWHHWGGCADGQRAETSSDSLLATSLLHFCRSLCLLQYPSKITPRGWSQWGSCCGWMEMSAILPVSLMELDAHLLWLGVKSAMMSSETVLLFSDYTADTTHKPTGGEQVHAWSQYVGRSHLHHWFTSCLVCRMYTHRYVSVS